MANPTAFARLLDASAIGLSGLCLAHCLALPIAAAFLPVLGTWAEAEWVHLVFLGAAAPISAVALHRSGGWRWPGTLTLAIAGVGLLGAGVFLASDERLEIAMTVSGGLALSGAHVLNWRRHGHGPTTGASIAATRHRGETSL